MNRIFKTKRQGYAPADESLIEYVGYEPPRVNAYTHQASVESASATDNSYNEPPRVPGWVAHQSPAPYYGPGGYINPSGLDEPPSTNSHTVSIPETVPEEEDEQGQAQPNKRPKPVPPTAVVEPFGATNSTEALAPIAEEGEPKADGASVTSSDDITKRPTCSLSLVCYSRECLMTQIRVAKVTKFHSHAAFETAIIKNPTLITTDEGLFKALQERYRKELCGTWRRYFSLKTLRRLRLLSYTETTRPTPVPMDEFTMQEVLYAYNHPSEFGTDTEWIEWVFRLRQPDKRHALEFVEGWNATRIAIVGTIPCVVSTLIGIIWSARGGDPQTAFTIASFLLTLCTVLLALLAVISGIDSKSN